MSSYPRESLEFIFIDELALDDVPLEDFSSVQISVVDGGCRPAVWESLLPVNERPAFKIGPGAPHDYSTLGAYPVTIDVWGRPIEDDEAPVIYLGYFRVT